MMLHRHFEKERNENMTTLADVSPKMTREEIEEVEEAPDSLFTDEAPRRRGRPRKSED